MTRHKSDNEEESCSYTSTWATLIVSGCIWRGVLQKDVCPGMCPLSYHKLWKSPRTPGWCIKWGLALMGAFTTFTIDRIWKNTNKTLRAQLKVSATLLVSRGSPKCKRKKRSGYARLQPYSTLVRVCYKISWEDALIDKLKWHILAYNTCEILYNCIILYYWFTCSRGYQVTFTDSDWE